MIPPHEGIQQTHEHIFSHALLEPSIRCQCSDVAGTFKPKASCATRRPTYLNVSFLIFSRTSHGPRATYSKNSSADTSCTRKRIFHIRGRSVGSCRSKLSVSTCG